MKNQNTISHFCGRVLVGVFRTPLSPRSLTLFGQAPRQKIYVTWVPKIVHEHSTPGDPAGKLPLIGGVLGKKLYVYVHSCFLTDHSSTAVRKQSSVPFHVLGSLSSPLQNQTEHFKKTMITVGTKITAEPEKCFQELLSERLRIFLQDGLCLELIIVSSNFQALLLLQDKLLESV